MRQVSLPSIARVGDKILKPDCLLLCVEGKSLVDVTEFPIAAVLFSPAPRHVLHLLHCVSTTAPKCVSLYRHDAFLDCSTLQQTELWFKTLLKISRPCSNFFVLSNPYCWALSVTLTFVILIFVCNINFCYINLCLLYWHLTIVKRKWLQVTKGSLLRQKKKT